MPNDRNKEINEISSLRQQIILDMVNIDNLRKNQKEYIKNEYDRLYDELNGLHLQLTYEWNDTEDRFSDEPENLHNEASRLYDDFAPKLVEINSKTEALGIQIQKDGQIRAEIKRLHSEAHQLFNEARSLGVDSKSRAVIREYMELCVNINKIPLLLKAEDIEGLKSQETSINNIKKLIEEKRRTQPNNLNTLNTSQSQQSPTEEEHRNGQMPQWGNGQQFYQGNGYVPNQTQPQMYGYYGNGQMPQWGNGQQFYQGNGYVPNQTQPQMYGHYGNGQMSQQGHGQHDYVAGGDNTLSAPMSVDVSKTITEPKPEHNKFKKGYKKMANKVKNIFK